MRVRFVQYFVMLLLAGLTTTAVVAKTPAKGWQTLDWVELMPPEDLKLLESLPEVAHEGSGPALLPDEILTGRVRPEMNNMAIRIPGFVVPLETLEDQRVTEFFLVPYYGACIHVPPPPPNQIIHIRYPAGLKLEALTDPFWINGVLKIERVANEVATASYTMTAEQVEPYRDE